MPGLDVGWGPDLSEYEMQTTVRERCTEMD